MKHLLPFIAFLMMIGSQVSAGANAETIQYIFDKHEAECIAEQYEGTARPRAEMWVLVFFQLINNNVTHYQLGQFLNQKSV